MSLFTKNIYGLALATCLLAACGKEEKPLSPKELQAKADSIVQSRAEKLRRQAQDDLDKRLPIELKPRVDSLLKGQDLVQPVPVFPGDEQEPAGEASDSTAKK